MATIANKMSHVVVSKSQAELMALAVVKYLIEQPSIEEKDVVLYRQTIVIGFWYLSAAQQLGVLEQLHSGLSIAKDKFVKSAIRELITELSRNHATCMKESIKDEDPNPNKFYDFSFEKRDDVDVSDFEYCIVSGKSGKMAFVEAKTRAEEGIVEFEFMNDTKRYLIVDTNVYDEAEAIERMVTFKLSRTRSRTVYVILLKSENYLFFRYKEKQTA